MWSHLYEYYTIQKEPLGSAQIETGLLTDILLQTNCLKENNWQSFSNKSPFPWLEVSLHFTLDGNYSSGSVLTHINLISLVCSKTESQEQYRVFCRQIAKRLNWNVFLECDEDRIPLNEFKEP